MKQLTHIKVPENLFKISRERNVTCELLFYYELKRYRANGVIYTTDFETLASLWECSIISIRKKIHKLIQLQWIDRTSRGCYRLAKYDHIFHDLGYDISRKIRLKKYNVALLIYHKAHNPNPCTIKDLLQLRDIAHNIKKQLFNVNRRTTMHADKQNVVASLRCDTIAEMMGYVSTTTGWRIEQRLQHVDLIRCHNRTVFVKKKEGSHFMTKARSGYVRQLANQFVIV